MNGDPISYQAAIQLGGLLVGLGTFYVTIRRELAHQFREQALHSEERSRRLHERIDRLEERVAETYVRKDVHAAERRAARFCEDCRLMRED